MIALLDTCTFLWLDGEQSRIPLAVREILGTESTVVSLSMVSVWEMAIKRSVGKLPAKEDLYDVVSSYVAAGAVTILPIRLEHAVRVESLPFHRRGPFDRLIIAQALVEGLPLISADKTFDRYGVNRVWG